MNWFLPLLSSISAFLWIGAFIFLFSSRQSFASLRYPVQLPFFIFLAFLGISLFCVFRAFDASLAQPFLLFGLVFVFFSFYVGYSSWS